MKTHSGHIVFNKKVQFKDLAPICKDLIVKFINETKQVSEDPDFLDIIVDANLIDLKNNRKPEGFNRMGNMRMIFPIRDREGVEFYIYRSSSSTDITRVTESISRLLQKKGLKHDVCWDKMHSENTK